MRINPSKCVGCGICIPYCTVEAISYSSDKKCMINEDACVECYVCYEARICPRDAFERTPLPWPRSLRREFSSPEIYHPATEVAGRGTEEMKTNDVTGSYGFGEAGFTVDVGRPGVGTRLSEAEKIAMALAKIGVEFEESNPVAALMVDKRTGRLRDDVKNERVLSCILEFKIKEDNLPFVIDALRDVAKHVDTVFSVGCIGRAKVNGEIPVRKKLEEAKMFYRPNGKTNIGLGKK